MMKNQEEKIMKPMNGFAALFVIIMLLLIFTALMVVPAILLESEVIGGALFGILLTIGIVGFCIVCVAFAGFKVLNPNEALVLSLFGKYHGSIYESGFYFVNPFCTAIVPKKSSSEETQKPAKGANMNLNVNLGSAGLVNKKVSTKISTFVNGNQKVNDKLGNPVEVSAIVIWKVINATKAVINIDNYHDYLSNQTDSTIRNVARLYPYDIVDDDDDPSNDEMTLRGSSVKIAEEMKGALQERVADAGIEIIDVRLNQIAYAPEIAAAMLQRQQATAIIAARQKIVEGAVSMVEMALDQLKRDNVVDLDEERKAQMVSNLLVVLCGSKEASPILNTGSIY